LSLDEKPEPHPRPEKLNSITLPEYLLRKASVLWRIHKTTRSALHFDRRINESRFNSPDGNYGVLYAGFDSYVAFRETIRVYSSTRIGIDFLEARCLSTIMLREDLRLVDLSGAGLTGIAADGRLTTGSYILSRMWSQALYNHEQEVNKLHQKSEMDGIYYRSRFDPSKFCIALYEDRAKPKISAGKAVCLTDISNPTYRQIFDEYGYKLDDD
jgi:RES domain